MLLAKKLCFVRHLGFHAIEKIGQHLNKLSYVRFEIKTYYLTGNNKKHYYLVKQGCVASSPN